MHSRRSFLAGVLAAGASPSLGWAAAGGPAFLSAAQSPDGGYALCGLSAEGDVLFELPLPARGHAAAAHPRKAEAVAFARRPGRFALVIDCLSGAARVRLDAPEGRHFYGHGAFSAEGDLLFTSENDYEAARGVIGVWDVRAGYRRVGEFPSGGVGPHELRLMPDGRALVVANGGIETHPELGRAKLNIATMRPNLSYVSLDGALLEQVELGAELHKASIRHLAVSAAGQVGFAMQWQGDVQEDVPLLGVHERAGGTLALGASGRQMRGYLGSVAFARDGQSLAVTSPRSGLVEVFATADVTPVEERAFADVCGVAAAEGGFVVTTGEGLVAQLGARAVKHGLRWDNHLVSL